MLSTSSEAEAPARPFAEACGEIAELHYARVLRYLTRLSGDPELSADVVQEAFLRLQRRGALPDAPAAWLITVAANLFRNARTQRTRRLELLTPERGLAVHSEPDPPPDRIPSGAGARVRAALERLRERDRRLLLLLAEGFSYRDMAVALELNEASVGTLLSRAKRAFREAYQEMSHAP